MAGSWGLFWGGWAPLIPQIKSDLDLSDQQLGLALFAVPVGAVPAMLLTGRLARRLGHRVLPAVTALFAVSVLVVGLAPDRWTFTVALLLVGATSGAIEVALNATTAAHEARDGTRLFNKVHAVTPLVMVLAAPAVGLGRELGASKLTVLALIALLVAASALLAVDPRGWQERAETPAENRPGPTRGTRAFLTGPLLLVAVVGAAVLFMENAVEQWGAILLEEELGTGPLLASLGPAAYMAGLSGGRMLAQWRGDRLGDRTLATLGGTLGGLGIATAALADTAWLALAGFAVAGIGLAPVLPTLLGAAGRAAAPGQRATAVSAVTTASYAGFLSSPPLVGSLAGWLGLPTALGLVALGGLLVVAGARATRLLDPRASDSRAGALV
ncbi:MFS transporter [Streptomyces millisiae]|uniref:MFS transporter n=1 Tax=Streptomyces millisiae TaxID=3075542 RepID=A0ABU2LJJ2_9ACTN|nr:MFS transporter [Streptomyces sp. DSM 44918]MDT0317660.1 MFS transporter [Streptomyces sp. DSM 44918]